MSGSSKIKPKVILYTQKMKEIFVGKTPMLDILLPNLKDMLRIYLDDNKTAFEGIKSGIPNENQTSYTHKTKKGKEVVFEISKDLSGREYLSKIILDGKEYTNIQFYENGCFAVVGETFLGLDQFGINRYRQIKLQDDSKLGDKLKEEIDINSGKIIKQIPEIQECLSCSGKSTIPKGKDIEIHFKNDLWNGSETIKISNKAEEKTELIIFDFNKKNKIGILYNDYVDYVPLDRQKVLEQISTEFDSIAQKTIATNSNTQVENTVSYFTGQQNIQNFGNISNENIIKNNELLGHNIKIKEKITKKISFTLVSNTKLTEEENPILRCIMDPVFRKLYGAMYGFVDGEEYKARRVVNNKIPAKAKPVNNTKLKESQEKEKIKKSKEDQIKFNSLKRQKVEDDKKTKKEYIISPLKKHSEPKEIKGEKQIKTSKSKMFETFLSKELKLGKEKIKEFVITIEKLNNKLKSDIREFIIKVNEIFKLQENIEKIKEKIGNNWVLINTKIKLQKLITSFEYKVEKLRFAVKKKFEKIKFEISQFIRNALDMRKNLDRLLAFKRIVAIRKMEIVAFIMLILRWFK